MMRDVGLLAFQESMWPSLERTRAFYQETIAARFQTRDLGDVQAGIKGPLPDAIVNFMGAAGWTLPELPGCPLIFGMHGGAILDQAFLRQHLGRLRTTDVLLVNCQSDSDILQGMFEGEGPVCSQLPLPVDGQYFRPLDNAEVRAQLPLADVDYVVGYVCRLLPQKNLHRYLLMLRALKAALPGKRIKGIIIGKYWVDYPVLNYVTETYPGYIQQQIQQYGLQQDLLYFPGNLSNEELGLCYNAMDVLIHPTNSIDENFGYAPVEAMACGTPVIGAAYGGVKDTVIRGETGYLMPTWMTPAGIRMDSWGGYQAALRLLQDEALRRQMSAAALKRAEYFSRENCSRILADTIEAAIIRYQQSPGRPVQLRPEAPVPAKTAYLPAIEQSWEHYIAPVQHYVSIAVPKVTLEDQVYLAAPLHGEGAATVVLDDPAWPARYELNTQERAVVTYCDGTVSVKELLAQSGADLPCIQHLVDIGLLCYTAMNN
ncbi:glycosyltransferase family 4 protein [Chitinophaga pendula]|uniref:glycosyltransferase family 4 protein n=1 Tax=Chitinophaga TaxID=79328 RepID=UPI000BB0B6F4|nr:MULTISPECIES: glycosyltransferase family 4 protein [Chitinophaga]ASZ13768.1 hypothetical protein CK934_23850 [Chitinophaga sp. MD30]UCJ08612.1 glycosyltransferase family 4 protein [Chitinophaga pendula]